MQDKAVITLSVSKADTGGWVLALIMMHRHGVETERIHRFAWEVFLATTEVARRLGLYGAGQDLLSDAFSADLPVARCPCRHGRIGRRWRP